MILQFQTFVQCNKILMFISNYENYRKNMRIIIFFIVFFTFFKLLYNVKLQLKTLTFIKTTFIKRHLCIRKHFSSTVVPPIGHMINTI